MRRVTKEGKRKNHQKAFKLIQSDRPMDNWKGRKMLKQATRVPWGTATKSNY